MRHAGRGRLEDALGLYLSLLISALVDPLVILAGVVPYFGIRNAPWRSLGGAAAAGAFLGVARYAAVSATPGLFAMLVAASIAAACVWWAMLHWGRRIVSARERAMKARTQRPRLVRDEEDWRK